MFAAITGCIQEAIAQGSVCAAALTGGGDTRLILACLLLLQQQERQQAISKPHKNDNQNSTIRSLIFKTHSKQQTDWQIARHLANIFQLKHERIRAISNKTEGLFYNPASLHRLKKDTLLSSLHHQVPLRTRQTRVVDRHKEDALSYTLHGRFGTEFLGCLCFHKSPLDIRTKKELEEFRPEATRFFQAIFRTSGDTEQQDHEGNILNPIDTLCDRFQELEEDRRTFENRAASLLTTTAGEDRRKEMFSYDIAYVFQLQLYTRSNLSDIYKGLRGGSWFSIPTAYFSWDSINPFLDNRLLQLMICRVSTREKAEPYELYGRMYQSVVPDILLKIPSNNKLLCHHTQIPRVIKTAEAKARPYFPKFTTERNRCTAATTATRRQALASLEEKFKPVFWKGATAFFGTAPVAMDSEAIAKDDRAEVRAFVDLVGDSGDACLLSGRLQSFLLWYEKRFLLHQ